MSRKISAPFSVDIEVLEQYIKLTEKNGEKSVSAPVQRFLEDYIKNSFKYKKELEELKKKEENNK